MAGPALRRVILLAIFRGLAALLVLASLALAATLPGRAAEVTQRRLALVLGNASYPAAPLATSANDAGLIAAVLRDAGFEVAAARDLDLATAQQSVQEFVNRLEASGPETVAFVYLSGYGAQILGENYLLLPASPVLMPDNVPAQGLLLSQLLRALAAVPVQQRIVVLDLARADAMPGVAGLTAGLALPDVPPGMLLAMNTAPGTIAEHEPGPYGAYALALGATLREPGLPLDEAFVRTRLRSSMLTGGAQTPWHASTLREAFVLIKSKGVPQAAEPAGGVRARPVSALPEGEAYVAALDRDTLKGYSEFLATFARSPLARRIAALSAARREALHWRHVVADDRPQAYWTYLQRYAGGAHASEARARLTALHADVRVPSVFAALEDGLAPPTEVEQPYVKRGVALDSADQFAPPPPPPAWLPLPPPWSPPRPPETADGFSLPVPELYAVDGADLAAFPKTMPVAAPAAVTAALAAQKLFDKKPVVPLEIAPAAKPVPPNPLPAKPVPVVILPSEANDAQPQAVESLGTLANTPATPPVVTEPPKFEPTIAPEPTTAAPRPAPVFIIPVETPPAPEAPAATSMDALRPALVPILPVEASRPAPVAITPVEAPHPAPVPLVPVEAPRTTPVPIMPVETPAPAPVAITPVEAPKPAPVSIIPVVTPRPAPVPIVPVDVDPVAVPAPVAAPIPTPVEPVHPPVPAIAPPPSAAPLVPMPPALEETGLPPLAPSLPVKPAPVPLLPPQPGPVPVVPNTPVIVPPAIAPQKPAPAVHAPNRASKAKPRPAATIHKPAPRAELARPAPVRAAPPARRAEPVDAGSAPLDLHPPLRGGGAKARKPPCGGNGQADCP